MVQMILLIFLTGTNKWKTLLEMSRTMDTPLTQLAVELDDDI